MNTNIDKQSAVALEKLKQLNRSNLSTQISNMLLAFLCYFLLKNENNYQIITLWISIFSFIAIFRTIIPYMYKKSYINGKRATRNLNFYRYGIFISGFMWGFGALFIYPHGDIELIFFFVFVLMGIVAGALLVYSIDSISAFGYPITILLPLIYSLSLDWRDETMPILFGTILYFIFVMINIRKIAFDRENYISSNYELILKEKEKASSEERYRLLLNHSPIGIVHYDMNLKVSYHNQQFIDIMGINLNSLKTINLDNLKDQSPIKSAKEALKGKMTEYNGFYKMSFSKKVLWLNVLSSPVKDFNNNIVGGVSIIQDITEQKNAEDEIKKLAFYDSLTLLPNRRMFIDKLNLNLQRTQQKSCNGAIMFLDLDFFKSLNDTLGHDYGDMLLKEVAHRLKDCVKKRDIVSRFGGDEFVILLDGQNSSLQEIGKSADKVSKRVLKVLSKPFNLLGNKYTTSASIGVVVFGENSYNQKDLLKFADIAMYQAKKSGRNIVKFFDHTMQHEITKRVSMETELQEAIKNREFILHYQPQVNNDGSIYGAEALVRWQHPSKGLIYPKDFISIAEEKGFIIEMGNQILEIAFAQMAKWKKSQKMKNINISINISATQFEQDDFTKNLFSLIKEYQIDTNLIKLELTEGTLLKCSEQIVENMLTIRKRGIRFSLDDFGIGYSSLFYLKKLPINELKIDQTFVRDINSDSNDYAIIKTIIAIAKSFEFGIIAEGVETQEQRDSLLELECQRFQGYFFSKPITAEKLEDKVLNPI